MKNKIIFIPGWMNTLETYKEYAGLEIWKDDFYHNEKIRPDFIIGHSLGANYVLLNWRKYPNAKLILINPLLPKRNPIAWFIRFLKFHSQEGLYKERRLVSGLKYFWLGIIRAVKLLSCDLYQEMENVPQKNLYVVRGEKDNFLCNGRDAEILKEKKINLIEIEDLGHNWGEKFCEVIGKITSDN